MSTKPLIVCFIRSFAAFRINMLATFCPHAACSVCSFEYSMSYSANTEQFKSIFAASGLATVCFQYGSLNRVLFALLDQ